MARNLIQKGQWFKPCLVALCALMLTSTTPRKAAAQNLDGYPLLLSLVIEVLIEIDKIGLPPDDAAFEARAGKVLYDYLSAADSSSHGSHPDSVQEIAYLSQGIGATHALLGMTSSCDVCGKLSDDLQQIIEIAVDLKLQAQAKKDEDGDDKP